MKQAENKYPPTSIAVSTDGKIILMGKDNGSFDIWLLERPRSFEETKWVVEGPTTFRIGSSPIVAVKSVNETQFIAAAGDKLQLCDGKRGERIGEPYSTGVPISAITYSSAT
ncbi:MAG: hypothetical protein K8T89_17760, partial [Planctomycetes bacterium]|nr:hypothetical protein [Planctomycetota bacterium]